MAALEGPTGLAVRLVMRAALPTKLFPTCPAWLAQP